MGDLGVNGSESRIKEQLRIRASARFICGHSRPHSRRRYGIIGPVVLYFEPDVPELVTWGNDLNPQFFLILFFFPG